MAAGVGGGADAAATVRSVLAGLPDVLDSPQRRAGGRTSAGLRRGVRVGRPAGGAVSDQAGEHAAQRVAAGRDIPTPERVRDARASLVEQIAVANARSGGRYAVPLAQAEAAITGRWTPGGAGLCELTTPRRTPRPVLTRRVRLTGRQMGPLRRRTRRVQRPPIRQQGLHRRAAPIPRPPRPHRALVGLAGMLPSMIPTVLGAAGLLGGLVSSVAAVPEALMQAGTQAASAATQGLSGVLAPKADSRLDTGGMWAGRDRPVVGWIPAGPVVVTASAVAVDRPPRPPVGRCRLASCPRRGRRRPPRRFPAGAGTQLGQGAGGGTPGVMPMGMPMGAMGGGPGSSGGGLALESGSKRLLCRRFRTLRR